VNDGGKFRHRFSKKLGVDSRPAVFKACRVLRGRGRGRSDSEKSHNGAEKEERTHRLSWVLSG